MAGPLIRPHLPAMRFCEFWPLYLDLHGHPGNRALHLGGTAAALALLAAAVVTASPWPAVAAPVVGYGAAWCGHLLVEGNRPATLGHPLLSLAADLCMLGLFVSGRLGREIAARRNRQPS